MKLLLGKHYINPFKLCWLLERVEHETTALSLSDLNEVIYQYEVKYVIYFYFMIQLNKDKVLPRFYINLAGIISISWDTSFHSE